MACLIMTYGFELVVGVSLSLFIISIQKLCVPFLSKCISWQARKVSRSLTGKASDKADFNIIHCTSFIQNIFFFHPYNCSSAMEHYYSTSCGHMYISTREPQGQNEWSARGRNKTKPCGSRTKPARFMNKDLGLNFTSVKWTKGRHNNT